MLRNLLLVFSLALTPLAAHETPTINAVVSAAGVVTDVSPGGIATVWGLDFSFEALGAEGLPLPVKIGETSVTINGVECPLFYVSEFQINLQIPLETPTDIEVVLLVEHEGLVSEPFTLIVRTDAISVFTYERVPQSGVFEPVVLHADGVTLVTPENPAKTNEVLVIYATGFGPLLNGPLTGMPAPFPPNDSLTVALPAAIYSTNQAGSGLTVQYSGLAAGFV
ncbi:MAG: hypothetical protein O2795_07710, partial [Acidobacteria bacterium]|nr:hypothetical protein [Acidobacteriota bacterium]